MILAGVDGPCVSRLDQAKVKKAVKRELALVVEEHAEQVVASLPSVLQRAVTVAQEPGASCLVTSLPLQRYGLALSKNEFRDAVCLRYMWPLRDLPSRCVCGSLFSVDHSQMCHTGGFINARYDAVRDLLATYMRVALHDVQTEPQLIPLDGEVVLPACANKEHDARADIRARGFWRNMQSAFFDVMVFYTHAPSYISRGLSALCKSFEKEKKRLYEDRVLHVDNSWTVLEKHLEEIPQEQCRFLLEK